MLKKLSGPELGVLLVGAFNLIGAFQEVYLGNLFQTLDPVLVMVTTFFITAFLFVALEIRRLPTLVNVCKTHFKAVLLVNASTTMSWLGFFMALKYLEPAIVSAMCFAVGPVLTTAGSRFLRPEVPLLRLETISAGGTLAGLVILAASTLTGTSSIGSLSLPIAALGLGLSATSALGIMGNTFFQKRLSEAGLTAQQVMCLRFWMLILVGTFLVPDFTLGEINSNEFILQSLFIAVFTVVLPLYILQLGIERLEPITVSLILATMPIVTFFLQLFDSRLVPSFYTLIGVTLCLVFSVVGIFARIGIAKDDSAHLSSDVA